MHINLCNLNFTTQSFCYKKKVHTIDEYIENPAAFKDKQYPITCQKGHLLVFAHGRKRRPYFRHLNPADTGGAPMTHWHAEWQGNFTNTEVDFKWKNSNQISSRRADVQLPDGRILEIQHSEIAQAEVNNRKNDYTNVHGKHVIWLIHANGAVDVTLFKQSGRVYLEFTAEYWKYTSFTAYTSIYLDVDEAIYKFDPNKVRGHMIDVEPPQTKADFIQALKTGVDLWANTTPHQSTLFVKQQGAGNGKTYGIIQMLEAPEFAHYERFLFVTKQHSAKTIIKDEFESQIETGKLSHISEAEIDNKDKKYIITYTNSKTGKQVVMVIATIDSLMYNIGNKDHDAFDKFTGIIDSIIDDYINVQVDGTVRFAGVNPKLNKETLIVIDETQDLAVNYGKALINIMRNRYVDLYIVGDRLQSISNELNAFTYLADSDYPCIALIKLHATNFCRRFTHPKLVQFVNTMTPFTKYGLPHVEPFESTPSTETNPLVFFKTEPATKDLNSDLKTIMDYFIKEVETHNRQPNDFLIITPFTQKNPLVDALQGSINTYWKDRIAGEKDEFFRYAIFHKSENGTSIDLDESKESTRIVSIHSSKGDGRAVVFLVGFSESALKRFSFRSDTLIYDSLVHVAVTRMKSRLYIHCGNNHDKFFQKIQTFISATGDYTTNIIPDLRIYHSIKYQDLVQFAALHRFTEFHEQIITEAGHDLPEESSSEKRIVDTGNHIIRFASLLITVLINIVNKEQGQSDDLKRQIIALLYRVTQTPIHTAIDWYDYNSKLNEQDSKKTQRYVPIVRISHKGRDYNRYYAIILENMRNIKAKLLRDLNSPTGRLSKFCPFELVILHHMLDIICNGRYLQTTIGDLYNIVDIYVNSYELNTDGHDHCLCNKYVSDRTDANPSIDKMKAYLHLHFEKVKYIDLSMARFHETYPRISWLYNHVGKYGGENKDFKIWQAFQLIGYDEENVIIGYVKPQFNSLNYNELLMSSICDSYLLQNLAKTETRDGKSVPSENYVRFHGKNLVTVVFALDHNEPYYLRWGDRIEANATILKTSIRTSIKEHYTSEHGDVLYFYRYWQHRIPEAKQTPLATIGFILDKYSELELPLGKEHPVYIYNFLHSIQLRLEDITDRGERAALLALYDSDEYFLKTLDGHLDRSIMRHLNMVEAE